MKHGYILKDFNNEHVKEAENIAMQMYMKQREKIENLPDIEKLPSLERYAKNGMGVSVFFEDRMVGFIGCHAGIENFFGTSKGVYSPEFAHGVTEEDRAYLYTLMYQYAARKWVADGLLSHVISVYAGDADVLENFVWNGFGYRTVEATMDPSKVKIPRTRPDLKYFELPKERYPEILENQNRLIRHLNESPSFVTYKQMSMEQFNNAVEKQKARFFVAEDNGFVIAHIKLSEEGESAIGNHESAINICGAYMRAEYRGKGIYDHLLSYTIEKMQQEGYSVVEVDCESFNPNARGFWLKYFTPVIFGLARRIDERILDFKL